MDFSLFFFTGKWPDAPGDHYRLFRDSIRFADEHGFSAVWTPERHFNRFGGLYPNPAVTGAAAAVITQRIGIRAGSVVMPLQDPLRVAEEWSMVDNLSQGRVGVSFASGWHVNDFVLSPSTYGQRRDLMYERIRIVQRLWQGEPVRLVNGAGQEVEVSIFPRPFQSRIPIWITAQSEATCKKAGEIGANLLTNMNYHAFHELKQKIAVYRQAFSQSDDGQQGSVTLMVHTFVGDSMAIDSQAKPAYAEYLRTNIDLQSELAKGLGLTIDSTEEDIQFLVSRALNRMINEVGLIGSPELCLQRAGYFQEIGVDEIACLIDFGVDLDSVMCSLEKIEWISRALLHVS